MTAKQAATLLGIGVSTLHRLRSSGRVPEPVKIGGSVRWRREELKAWVDAGCPPVDKWVLIWARHQERRG